MRLLLLGATGLVGGKVLEQAIQGPTFNEIIAPTRKPLLPQPRLKNPVNPRLEQLASQVAGWDVDAILCALGTTRAKAGSDAAFRHVDYALPMIFATAGRAAGVRTFALVSAVGASTSSRFLYARTKGEVERDIEQMGYPSLTICRPSILAGGRDETRVAEGIALALARVLAPILPKKVRANPVAAVAATLLKAASEARPGTRRISAEEMI